MNLSIEPQNTRPPNRHIRRAIGKAKAAAAEARLTTSHMEQVHHLALRWLLRFERPANR